MATVAGVKKVNSLLQRPPAVGLSDIS